MGLWLGTRQIPQRGYGFEPMGRVRCRCVSGREAERLFQRAIADSEVIDALIEEVDRDIEEQKEYMSP